MGDTTWYKKFKPKSEAEAEGFEGVCWRHGYDREVDHEKAFAHFLKAAEMGELSSFQMVVECYQSGCGVAEDPVAAADWSARRFALRAGFEDWREWDGARFELFAAEQEWRSQFRKRPVPFKKP